MTPDDHNLATALVHHANVILSCDDPGNLGRETELDDVKRSLKLAEKILSHKATDDDRAAVGDAVRPQVRALLSL